MYYFENKDILYQKYFSNFSYLADNCVHKYLLKNGKKQKSLKLYGKTLNELNKTNAGRLPTNLILYRIEQSIGSPVILKTFRYRGSYQSLPIPINKKRYVFLIYKQIFNNIDKHKKKSPYYLKLSKEYNLIYKGKSVLTKKAFNLKISVKRKYLPKKLYRRLKTFI